MRDDDEEYERAGDVEEIGRGNWEKFAYFSNSKPFFDEILAEIHEKRPIFPIFGRFFDFKIHIFANFRHFP